MVHVDLREMWEAEEREERTRVRRRAVVSILKRHVKTTAPSVESVEVVRRQPIISRPLTPPH